MILDSLKTRLSKTPRWFYSLIAMLAAFTTYACMYAFRRAFTAAGFEDLEFFGLELKTALIIAQVLGYTLSKFAGIKIISEMLPNKRPLYILGFILFAHLMLFFFWIVPTPFKPVFLFLNGLPLGMVWGLVFSYLEGRRNTELLGAGLSVSFIVSSGFVKSAGSWLMISHGVSEFAMPFATGLLFVVPLFFFVWLLNQTPDPDAEDIRLRVVRGPMSFSERVAFFKRFSLGIILLTLCYMLLTAYRDLRDNYALEILSAIGFTNDASIFTRTEAPIALIVLIVMASLMFIKNNKSALIVNHFIIGFGLVLIGFSTYAFKAEIIDAYWWMVLVGLGSYLGYVPFNCILFDRFIATYRTYANAGFLIYIADSFGYLSSVGILLYKNLGHSTISWFDFFISFSTITSVVGIAITVVSLIYFINITQC